MYDVATEGNSAKCAESPIGLKQMQMKAERQRAMSALSGAGCNATPTRATGYRALPSRYEIRERMDRLRNELALCEVVLAQWTDETDGALRFASNLRELGYAI